MVLLFSFITSRNNPTLTWIKMLLEYIKDFIYFVIFSWSRVKLPEIVSKSTHQLK